MARKRKKKKLTKVEWKTFLEMRHAYREITHNCKRVGADCKATIRCLGAGCRALRGQGPEDQESSPIQSLDNRNTIV